MPPPTEQPGDRYLYRPAGHRGPHWHEVVRVVPCPWSDWRIVSRCLARRDCGTR